MSFEQIILLLTAYKYLFLFPIVVAEGPIATVIAGFLVSLGHLNIFIAYAVVIIGDLVGDSIYYALGYYGEKKFAQRLRHLFRITPNRVNQIEKHFRKHPGKTLIIGKLSHAVGMVVLVAAGIAKVPFWKFIWYNFISTLPKSLLLLLIGFYFGKSYAKISTYLDYTAIGTIALAIVSVVTYFAIKNISKKYESKNKLN